MDRSQIELAEVFGSIARSLLAEHDVDRTLRRIVTTAVELIDECEHAGIALVRGGEIIPVAPSDDVAERVDAIQNEVDEGPCFSAIREHEVFVSDDLQVERRWPRFAARAFAETGIRSIMGFRLFDEEDTLGALNLYSSAAAAFDTDTLAIGSVLATHAAVALAAAREREQMGEALASRDLIGQAKGILMARGAIDDAEAFDLLRRASQRLNVKLRVVADQVVHPEGRPPQGGDPAGGDAAGAGGGT